MAENPKFNNSDMFKDVTTNTGHTDIDVDNKSEVLATRGNVINSIKTFWNKLRKKLVYAITRENINNAYGDTYHPVYVNSSGIVQVCNPTTLQGSVTNNNINLDQIKPLYSGQIVCITVTNTTTNNTSFLTINNKNVYYPTGVQVKVSDVSNNTTYLFTFISGDGDKWILNNKINVVMKSNKTSDNNSTGTGGHPGLMTADDKAKLDKIEWGANYFTYELPIANSNKHGGVKSSSNNDTDSNNKVYHVSVNTNGIMTVNVPWLDTHNTAVLRAGGDNNNENETTINGNTYLKIVDGTSTSKIKVSGSGGTSVSSDSSGNITINSPRVDSYSKLDSSNNNPSLGYLIKGSNSNSINKFLAGNGSWQDGKLVPIPTSNDYGKTLKCDGNGNLYWG